MKIIYLPRFSREYKKLPADVQDLAERKEKVFRKDPFDPKLKTHKLHGELIGFWSFSINYDYRIIFEFLNKNTVRFYSIGNHDIYE
ncbi:MAG: type II toxin-antitoxin system mRNA interferase toxin, RelE/StbE family [Candidatus Pacebacteria bacterium]|nr:type II toxin-antitoxin system mRNA interferase toxin, RelE/StbE family [Candidatus Paceibacterota bacterium]NUQ56885.1 type II toxin-antitoxin system mRNA interferase toxin, RelE/StbE family [Candidatus Paceibacter sp.]